MRWNTSPTQKSLTKQSSSNIKFVYAVSRVHDEITMLVQEAIHFYENVDIRSRTSAVLNKWPNNCPMQKDRPIRSNAGIYLYIYLYRAICIRDSVRELLLFIGSRYRLFCAKSMISRGDESAKMRGCPEKGTSHRDRACVFRASGKSFARGRTRARCAVPIYSENCKSARRANLNKTKRWWPDSPSDAKASWYVR